MIFYSINLADLWWKYYHDAKYMLLLWNPKTLWKQNETKQKCSKQYSKIFVKHWEKERAFDDRRAESSMQIKRFLNTFNNQAQNFESWRSIKKTDKNLKHRLLFRILGSIEINFISIHLLYWYRAIFNICCGFDLQPLQFVAGTFELIQVVFELHIVISELFDFWPALRWWFPFVFPIR